MSVGLVIVSHSVKLAEGVVELAAQMAQDVALRAAGGNARRLAARDGEQQGRTNRGEPGTEALAEKVPIQDLVTMAEVMLRRHCE